MTCDTTNKIITYYISCNIRISYLCIFIGISGNSTYI